MDWKSYPGDRLISKHQSGFFIIRPRETQVGQPIFCPFCNFIMNGIYDDESWKKFECCDSCANEWAYPNQEEWKNGWRPTPEQIQNKLEKRLFNTQERL